MKCEICEVDEAAENHHLIPRQRQKKNQETIQCCGDCAKQVHMLFNEQELADMSLDELIDTPQIQKYLTWKEKHPGDHRHKMSNRVKSWKKGHR